MSGREFRTVVIPAEGIANAEQRQRLGKVARILLRPHLEMENPSVVAEGSIDDLKTCGQELEHRGSE